MASSQEKVPRFDWDEARRLRAEGLAFDVIGERLGVTGAAVRRVVTGPAKDKPMPTLEVQPVPAPVSVDSQDCATPGCADESMHASGPYKGLCITCAAKRPCSIASCDEPRAYTSGVFRGLCETHADAIRASRRAGVSVDPTPAPFSPADDAPPALPADAPPAEVLPSDRVVWQEMPIVPLDDDLAVYVGSDGVPALLGAAREIEALAVHLEEAFAAYQRAERAYAERLAAVAGAIR